MEAILDLIIFLTLLALGYGFGQWAERRHYQSIRQREADLADVLVFSERLPPPDPSYQQSSLVGGNVVVSVDYFKRFLATLRAIVGGRVVSYESLLDRARRESLLRMKQHAKDLGYQAVFNVKIETSSISKGSGQNIGSIEVYSYGTGVGPKSA